MTTNFIGAVADKDRLVSWVAGKHNNVLFPPPGAKRDIRERAQDEATIDAENILLQADEAPVMG